MLIIPIKRLSEEAQIPTRANRSDAGYDLYASQPVVIQPGKRALVKTGISIAIPEGYYGRVAPRSGFALKQGVAVGAGVIDSGYRGEIGVLLFNQGDRDVSVSRGDRVAQLIITKCYEIEWKEADELGDSERAEGGFGSSGI